MSDEQPRTVGSAIVKFLIGRVHGAIVAPPVVARIAPCKRYTVCNKRRVSNKHRSLDATQSCQCTSCYTSYVIAIQILGVNTNNYLCYK